MSGKGMRSLEMFDLRLSTGSFSDAADFIVDNVAGPGAAAPVIVTHLNVNNYYHLQKHADLKTEAGNECVIVFDGIGMKIGAMLLGKGWIPDLNGTDLFPLVMKNARRRRIRIFFLGASKAVLNSAVGEIEKLFGKYCVAGYHDGYFPSDDEAGVIDQINQSEANMLVIGMGFMKELEFTLRYRRRIKVPLIWNVGGLFDFVSGTRPRAPKLMRKCRLEWLFRLLLEPRRMFHRYVILTPWFYWQIVKNRCGRRGKGGSRPGLK